MAESESRVCGIVLLKQKLTLRGDNGLRWLGLLKSKAIQRAGSEKTDFLHFAKLGERLFD